MSTSTSSLSIRTTWPVTTSPSSIARKVASELGTIWPSTSSNSPLDPSTTRAWGFSISVCTGRSVAQPYHCRAHACSSDEAGRRAHPHGEGLRRARMRGQLCWSGRRPRARGLRREGADDRPLRDRRAPDFGLRDPHAVARRDGSGRLVAPDLRRAGRPHAAPHVALAASLDLLDVRLPRAVRAD